MSAVKCEAKLPSACRVHGIGKNLPDTVFRRLEAYVNQQLDRSAAYKRRVAGDDEMRFNMLQDAFAATLWQSAVKTYKYDTKLASYRTAQLPTIPGTTAQVDIHNKAVAVFNAATDLNLLTHRGERIPFKAVANHVKARNNCSRVTQLLVHNYDGADFGFDTDLQTVRVDAPDSNKPGMFWHHAAIKGERDGETYVVDYTINQFDKTATIPYVAPYATWVERLNTITGETWTEEHLGVWDIQGGETRGNLKVSV